MAYERNTTKEYHQQQQFTTKQSTVQMSRRPNLLESCITSSLQQLDGGKHDDDDTGGELGSANYCWSYNVKPSMSVSRGHSNWYNHHGLMAAITTTIIMMMLSMTIVDGFSSSSSCAGSIGRLSYSPLIKQGRSSSNEGIGRGVLVPTTTRRSVQIIGTLSSHNKNGINTSSSNGGGRITTKLHLSTNNNNNNKDSSSNLNNETTLKSLHLIQQWLLIHLPSLSNDDLKLYSMQLLQDGFDSVDKLEGVNNNNNTNNGGGGSGRLEDLYFMKKGHRRVLLQKIGKIREMKGNLKNRLRLFEVEEEEEEILMEEESGDGGTVEGGGQQLMMDSSIGAGKVGVEDGNNDDDVGSTIISEGDKYKPTIGSGRRTSSGQSLSSDDDDSLISLTAWENKQLEEFVYNEQEREAMDDKSRRRLKEIEDYLKVHRNNKQGEKEEGGGGGGDEYDTTTFEQKELGDFVYNEQTRGAMDDKSKRRLKEIEQYLKEKWQRELGRKDEGGAAGVDDEFDEYDTTTFEQKQLVDFVYNQQTRDAMDDKSKRRLKEIEAYIKDQQRQQRERQVEELNSSINVIEEEEEAASLSSPSLPASWNFSDLEDFMYNEQEREVMDDKGKRRLKEIEEYVRAERARLREGTNSGYDEEELLDDFAARYQGITTARDEKKTGGSVVSSSAAKEEKRLAEFREAWLARQRNAGGGVGSSSTNMNDEDLMDDFASRYQKLGMATADGVSGGSSDKSARRLKELDAFLRARQSRQSKALEEERETPMDDFEARYQAIGSSAADTVTGSSDKSARRLKELDAFLRARQSRQARALEDERETPMDDFEARYQAIGSSAADAVADGRRDKSSRRLRALDAFLKSRQTRAAVAAEEEALRLELLQKPMKDLTAKERKERIRVEEFQRRARIVQEKEGNRSDTNVANSSSTAAKRKSNEERRLEALNKWTAKQNDLVEKRRMAKMLEEYEQLKNLARQKKVKKVPKPNIMPQDGSTPSSMPPSNEDANIDDFFEKRRIHSMSTTLAPSNEGRKLELKSQTSSRSGEEDCVDEECFDITRNSFSERDSKSLATTLEPSNANAKVDSYVPGSKNKASDFLPPRSNKPDDPGFVGDKGFDISRSSYSERESRSLSTTLPPSNKNAKQSSYVPGSTSDDEDCVGEECVDITRSSFGDREVRSLSTTMPPSNKNAKRNSYVPGSKSGGEDCEGEECFDISRTSFSERESRSLSTTMPPSNKNAKQNSYVPGSTSDDEDCAEDECVDITRSSFPDREVRSLSTTLPPSNENAKTNSYVPESNTKTKAEGVEPEEYFDITTRLFQERGQSLSSGYQSVFKEEDRSEMNSRASSLYAKFQSKGSPPSRSPIRKETLGSKVSGQSDMEGAYMDITQRLWDERKSSSFSTPPASSFQEEEKSEMNDRRRPPKISPRPKEETGSFSSLSQFVNAGMKRRSDDSDGYVDASERFSDRSSFVQSVNSGTAKRGTTSGSYKDSSSRNVPETVGDHVDESERFSDRSSFVQSVNSGTNRKGMTSGSYKDRDATAGVSDERGDYVDESERFSERSSFVQSVNSGTAKRGTTAGSFEESKKRVRPESSSSNVDDGYQDITQNPFGKDRSSFVLRVNSGTRKIGTTTGSFRESKGKSEPEEKKYFSSDRSTLMGARTWRNEDAVKRNESDKYLSSDRSSIVGPPSIRVAGRSSDEHTKYLSSDRSSIVGAPSTRSAGRSSEEHNKHLTSDRSSLSGAPSIRKRGPNNEFLDTNQFSSNLSPSSPVKASATNKLWRTSSQKGVEESSIDTPPAFMKNLDMLAGGRKTIKKRSASDEYLNKNSFSQKLAPSTLTQAATVASRNNNPYLNKNGFNDIDNMRTSNASGARFKSSHDVSPDEKKRMDNLDTNWAKLPDFDEMAGKSAVGENAAGSRSPKRLEQDDEEYTMVGDFSPLERATSFVRDSNTATKSGLSGLADSSANDQLAGAGENLMAEEVETDSEFEVMNWLLQNLPELDEEDAVNYFVSLLEDGFDSTDMLDEVLQEDLYFMKDEHQALLMKNLAVEEGEAEEAAETKTFTPSEPDDGTNTELEDEKAEEVEDGRNATQLTAEEDAEETEPTNENDDDYTDITRAEFGNHVSLSSATPSLFHKESPTEDEPFSWQLDVRKEVTDESLDDIDPDTFQDQPAESNQLFQATPPLAVELTERSTVKESASVREKRSSKLTKVNSNSRSLFQATPPLTVELKEGMTAEEAALAREERLGGVPKVDQAPLYSHITEGMTAEEAEAARSTRLTAHGATPDEPTAESPKKKEDCDNISPPRDAIYQEYIARGFSAEQAQKLKDYYTTWTIGPSHEMKFSSVFTCPMSGEHFASGIMDNGEVWGGRVWYKNKKLSMNAAAAKALDCFAFRENNNSSSSLQRCDDEPYFEDEAPALSSPPPNVELPKELIQPDNT